MTFQTFRLPYPNLTFLTMINSKAATGRCSIKIDVLKNFAKFTGKRLCQSPSFNKVKTLLKKRLLHRCFPVNFASYLISLIANFSSSTP